MDKELSSYLTELDQYVCVDGASSCCLSVVSGVPQGSVLGPLLFTLMIMLLLASLLVAM